MTAEEVAEVLKARRVGTGKWQARCPAHDDRSPSLAIHEGRDSKVLLRCWAGCSLDAILEAAKLTLPSLFPNGPKPTRAQFRAIAVERENKEALAAQERQRCRAAGKKVRKLNAIVISLAAKLSRTADSDPAGQELTRLFHIACDRLREAEHEVEVVGPSARKMGSSLGLKEGID